MADLNRASIMGRLGADPEIRNFDNGDKVANFRIATSEKWKDKNSGEQKERTEWHSVSAFGPLADLVAKYCGKGRRVMVEGPIRTRKWQDQSGADRYSTEIVLSGFGARIDIIDWPENGGGTGGNGGGSGYDGQTGGGAGAGGAGGSGGYNRDGERQGASGGAATGGAGYGAGGRPGGSRDFEDDIPFAPEVR